MVAKKKITKKSKEEKETKTKETGGFFKKMVIAVLFVALAIGGSFLLWQNYQLRARAGDIEENSQQQELNEEEIQALLNKVSEHIVLPADEEPTIATIVDAEKLSQEQAFYSGVIDGDKVLIYMNAQKAIIYREADDKLINVGPIYTNQNEGGEGESVEQENDTAEKTEDSVEVSEEIIEQSEEPLTIEIRNGSRTAGVAGNMQTELSVYDEFDVIDIGDANVKNYEDSYIIDLTEGNKEAQLQALVDELAVDPIKEMPAGEDVSEAEVLIIIGE